MRSGEKPVYHQFPDIYLEQCKTDTGPSEIDHAREVQNQLIVCWLVRLCGTFDSATAKPLM